MADARTEHSDEAKGIEGLAVPIQGLLKRRAGDHGTDLQGARGHQGRPHHLPDHHSRPLFVLMPTVEHVTVSRRITEGGERQRLLELARELKPEGMGPIARTVAEGASREELSQDRDQLLRIWDGIARRHEEGGPKGPIYGDLVLPAHPAGYFQRRCKPADGEFPAAL